MAFDPTVLSGVEFGVVIDASDLLRLAVEMGAAEKEVHKAINDTLKDARDRVAGIAFRNLSGDEGSLDLPQRSYNAMNVILGPAATGLGSLTAVLNVRTGALRGSLVKSDADGSYIIQDDVFYGQLLEEGFTLKPWGREPGHPEKRPWMAPAIVEAHAEEPEVAKDIDAAVSRVMEAALGFAR